MNRAAAILINGYFQTVKGVDVKIDPFLLNFKEVSRILIKLVLFMDALSNDTNFGISQVA